MRIVFIEQQTLINCLLMIGVKRGLLFVLYTSYLQRDFFSVLSFENILTVYPFQD